MNRDLLILGTGRGLQVIILFATYRVLTTLLPEAEVGLYFLLLSVTSWFGLVVLNPVGVYLNRRMHAWHEQGRALRALGLFSMFLVVVALSAFPVLAVVSKFLDFRGAELWMVGGLVATFVFSNTLNQTVIPSLNLLHFRLPFVVWTVLTQILALALASIFVLQTSPGAIPWMFGLAAAHGVVALFALVDFARRTAMSRAAVESPVEKRGALPAETGGALPAVARFALPLAVTNICFWLLNQGYRPLIEQVAGLEYLALIGLGFGVASSGAVSFEYLAQQLFLPDFYRTANSTDRAERERGWNRLAARTLPLYFALAVFVTALAPFLMTILADPKFSGAWTFLSFGIWIEFFRMSSNTVALISHSEMETRRTILPYFIGGLVAVGGVWAGAVTPWIGWTVPIAVLVGHVVVFVALLISLRQLFQIRLSWAALGVAGLWTLPCLAAFAFVGIRESLLSSALVLVVFGAWFTFVLFRMWKQHEEPV